MRKIEFSNTQIKDIINKYIKEKISIRNIGKIYGVSESVIKRTLVENNISSRDNTTEISEEIVEQILDRYVNQHCGLISAGAPWGYSQKVVETVLKKAGIKKRNYLEAKQIARKYKINDDFFKTQNSEMAYILGFIAADGCVASKENSVSIQLQEKDEQILNDIKKIVKSERPIKYYTTTAGRKTVKFQIWSAEWKKDLKVYNIIPNKTFKLKPPYYLNKKYYIDYIRGYFDGDGTVYRHNNCCYWEIVGASLEVIEWIKNVLMQQYGIISASGVTSSYTFNNVKMYKIGFYTKDKVQKLYNILYQKQNCLCLHRKKEKFETILK